MNAVVDKLQELDTPDKKEVFLFQYLCKLERDLRVEFASVIQAAGGDASVQKQLVLFLTSPVPRPTRPIRNVILRILSLVFIKGDGRTIPDAIASLQNVLAAKKHDEVAVKISAIFGIGVLTEQFGAKASYLLAETVNLLLKILKGCRDADVAVKHEVLNALCRCLKGAGKSVVEAAWKDLIKYGKIGLTDKIAMIRADSAQLLEYINRYCSVPRLQKLEEFDAFMVIGTKGLDNTSYNARKAVANYIGFTLSTSQKKLEISENTVPASSTQSKSNPKSVSTNVEDDGVLSLEDMLMLLQASFVKATSREIRTGIVYAYEAALRELGRVFLERNYFRIVKHLTALVGQPKFTATDADGLLHRNLCSFLIREVIGKSLSESGQISALKDLDTNMLKKWSSLFGPESPSSKWVLTFILHEITSLLTDLGSASAVVTESISESLFNLLGHPSPSVNCSLSICMRVLCDVNSKCLASYIDVLVSNIQKDVFSLAGDKPELLQKFIGYGNALGSVICSARNQLMALSFESLAIVFGVSTQLMKAATNSKDSKLAFAQIQIAWTLLTAVASLGPAVMTVHTSQLLLMWKNTFPKTIQKESLDSDELAICSLCNREMALTAMDSFLKFNESLVTVDIAKRLIVLLNNALAAVTSVRSLMATANTSIATATPAQKKIQELELALKRRIFSCYNRIKPSSLYDMSHILLVKTSVSLFAPDFDQDKYQSGDKAALDLSSMTSLVFSELGNDFEDEHRSGVGILNVGSSDNNFIEQLIEPRVLGCFEYDFLRTFLVDSYDSSQVMPVFIAVIDSSIDTFSQLFPVQQAIYQESTLEQFAKCLKYSGNAKVSAGRKLAVQFNILIAIIRMLRSVLEKNGSLASEKVCTMVKDIAMDGLLSSNALLRGLSSDVVGLLARVSTADSVNLLMSNLIDKIVNNREPDARAGCSLALGCIHLNAGSMVMGPHLKTSIGVLHSLISDPHALVHTWALYSLWLVIESSSLMFGQYASATLSLIIKLGLADSHDASFNVSSKVLENNAAVLPLFGRILHALTGVLGPELSDSTRMRELCFSLFEDLKHDSDPYTVAEAIRCIQQFIMFAPKHVDLPLLLPFLQDQITMSVSVHLIKAAAVTCLYQLTQRDAGMVLDAAANMQLEERCFSLLDSDSDEHVRAEVRDILQNLLKQVAVYNPSRWIDMCKNILARGGRSSSKDEKEDNAGRNDDDDDEAGNQKSGAKDTAPAVLKKGTDSVVLVPRWRTQLFCISCMRILVKMVFDANIREHVDLQAARASQIEDPDYLVLRLGELVAISFNSATMPVKDLQLQGLLFLQDIITKFAAVPDPDFEGHALLEQYQAQITAALTPAFSSESTSELMSLATVVAGTYIGSGIVKEFHPSDRVLRLLGGALESCKKDDSFLPVISSSEKQMLRLSVLTAWAKLQLSSLKFQGSNKIIKDKVDVLAKLWVSSIFAAAEQKVDLDIFHRYQQRTNDIAKESGRLLPTAGVYLDATRQVLGRSFDRSWPVILQALCSLLSAKKEDSLRLNAFADADSEFENFVVIMLGLCVESISSFGFTHKPKATESSGDLAEEQVLELCLNCMKDIIGSKVISWPTLEKDIFGDLMSLFGRLLQQTENMLIQKLVIDSIREIFVTYRDDIPSPHPFFMASKLILNIFVYHIPQLSNNPTATIHSSLPSTPAMASLFASAIDTSLYLLTSKGFALEAKETAKLYLFILTALLVAEKFKNDVAPKALSSLKPLADILSRDLADDELVQVSRLVQATLQSLVDVCKTESDLVLRKNAVLGITLLTSSVPRLCENSNLQEKVSQAFYVLVSGSDFQTSRIALQCAKTLMSISLKDSSDAAQRTSIIYTRLFIPMIHCLILSSFTDLITNGLLDEALKVILLPGFTANASTMSLLVSTVVRLHSMAPSEAAVQQSVSYAIYSNLLSLASQNQLSFREMMVYLPPDVRNALESGLKTVIASGPSMPANATSNPSLDSADGGAVATAPKIQLKSFGV